MKNILRLCVVALIVQLSNCASLPIASILQGNSHVGS